MRAAILAIGDEIVGGLTTDTNSGWLAQELKAVGVETVGGFSVTDEADDIVAALERALADADLVVTTGGLGPTDDDLTTECVARVAGVSRMLHQPSMEAIEERFRARGIPMSETNRRQAMLPHGAEVIPNPNGTAPGVICSVVRGGVERHIATFPGVPREMQAMVAATLLPWVQARRPDRRYASRIFSTFGLSESKLGELIHDAFAPDEARVAYRAAFPRIQLRLTVSGDPVEDLERRLDGLELRVRERIGHYVYAVGDEGMEETVGRLLREQGRTLAVAESCTGGLIGHRITEVPGSSEYFLLGISAYSNAAKQALLGVRQETLEAHGAVSTQAAEEMAEGARRAGGAALGLSTTGIAGPGGGTPDKPVGTVCIAMAWEGGVWSRRYDLGTRGREWVKGMTAQIALDRLRRHLLDLSPELEMR